MKLLPLECVKQCFGTQVEVDLEKQQPQENQSTLTKISNISKDAISKAADLCSGAWGYLPSFSKVAPAQEIKDKKE